VLLIVLLAAASGLCGVGIWALTDLVKTSRSLRVLSEDLDERIIPLLEKADVTVDAMNAELLRIDQIVTRVEDVTERVNATSRTVQEVANAPAEIVNDLADRVRRAWKTRRQTHEAQSHDGEEHAPGEHSDEGADEAPHVDPDIAPEDTSGGDESGDSPDSADAPAPDA
jgi:hypothetical protein